MIVLVIFDQYRAEMQLLLRCAGINGCVSRSKGMK